MAQKEPIRIEEHKKALGDTYDWVKTPIVPHGEIWCFQGIAYENETGARGTFRRYIETRTHVHFLDEVQGPGAAELMTSSDILFLRPGERMTIRQASCTANDVLSLYAHGYRVLGEFIPPEE